MRFLRVVWKGIGFLVAVQYGYWAFMFTGAWLQLNDPPVVSLDWMALAFWGATIASVELVFPCLAEPTDRGTHVDGP